MNRVICVVTEEMQWEPLWVVQRADGGIYTSPHGGWAYFTTMREVVQWLARKRISPVELPAGVLYGQEQERIV